MSSVGSHEVTFEEIQPHQFLCVNNVLEFFLADPAETVVFLSHQVRVTVLHYSYLQNHFSPTVLIQLKTENFYSFFF